MRTVRMATKAGRSGQAGKLDGLGCQVGSWWCSGGAGLHLRCSSRSPVLAFVGSDCDGDGHHGSGHKVYKVSETGKLSMPTGFISITIA